MSEVLTKERWAIRGTIWNIRMVPLHDSAAEVSGHEEAIGPRRCAPETNGMTWGMCGSYRDGGVAEGRARRVVWA